MHLCLSASQEKEELTAANNALKFTFFLTQIDVETKRILIRAFYTMLRSCEVVFGLRRHVEDNCPEWTLQFSHLPGMETKEMTSVAVGQYKSDSSTYWTNLYRVS